MIADPVDLQSNQGVSCSTNYWVGDKYFYNSDQQKIVAELLIKQYSFKESDLVLDVGCGDGKITSELSKKMPHGYVVGIDPSESMINFAHAKFGSTTVHFQIGKASEIRDVNRFDVITSFSSLHWEPKQEEALWCFKKALKPGGTILLAIPGPDFNLRQALKEVCHSARWEFYFKNFQSPGRIWTANEYAKLLLDTGFIIRKIEVVERPHLFQTERDYKSFLEAMLPHLARLSKHQYDSFLDEVIAQIKGTKYGDETSIKFEQKVLEVIANS